MKNQRVKAFFSPKQKYEYRNGKAEWYAKHKQPDSAKLSTMFTLRPEKFAWHRLVSKPIQVDDLN